MPELLEKPFEFKPELFSPAEPLREEIKPGPIQLGTPFIPPPLTEVPPVVEPPPTPTAPSITPTVAQPTPEVSEPTQPTTLDPVGEIIDRKAKSLGIVLPDPVREQLKESIRRTNKWGLLFEAISGVGDVLAGTPGRTQAYHSQLREKRKALLGEYDTERFRDPSSNVSQKYQVIAKEYYPQMNWDKYSAKEITDLIPMIRDLLARQEAKMSSDRAATDRQAKLKKYDAKEARKIKIDFSKELLRQKDRFSANKQVQSFYKLSASFRKMDVLWQDYKADPTGKKLVTLDAALGTLFQRMIDEDSVVRTEEFQRLFNALPTKDKPQAFVQKLFKGGMKLGASREQIVTAAMQIMGVAKEDYFKIEKQYEGITGKLSNIYGEEDWKEFMPLVIPDYGKYKDIDYTKEQEDLVRIKMTKGEHKGRTGLFDPVTKKFVRWE